jgi:hypothetical protein
MKRILDRGREREAERGASAPNRQSSSKVLRIDSRKADAA